MSAGAYSLHQLLAAAGLSAQDILNYDRGKQIFKYQDPALLERVQTSAEQGDARGVHDAIQQAVNLGYINSSVGNSMQKAYADEYASLGSILTDMGSIISSTGE